MAIIIEWLLLAVSLVMITLPAVYRISPWLALPALAIFFILLALRAGGRLLRSKLLWPWLLFIASAVWGTWTSVAPEMAQIQFMRILAAFAVYCAVISAGERQKLWLAWITLAGIGLLAVYWPLRHQFAGDLGKFTIISRIGTAINSVAQVLSGPDLHTNVAGGLYAMGIPFGVALALWAWRAKRKLQAFLAGALSVLLLGVLALTSSRGAMLGLLAAGVLCLLAWFQYTRFPRPPLKVLFWGAVVLAVALLAGGFAYTGQLEGLLGSVPDPTGTVQSRMEIWRQGVGLVADYLFTGAGLGTFPIVFSIYTLLIHVPLHEHLHNIFLETCFEQGILGLTAMLWGMAILGVWVWRALVPRGAAEAGTEAIERKSSSLMLLGWAAVAALVAMGVHGMVDVVFYVKRSMPLVGLVLGFVALLDATPQPASRDKRLLAAGVAIPLLLVLLFSRQIMGVWYANLGALAQTRLELSAYNPDSFADPSLDEIRRATDLSRAEAFFTRSMDYQPGNRTALQRLAGLALSRGDYEAALAYTQRLVGEGYRDNTTRLLHVDALVANGSQSGAVNQAAEILRGLPSGTGRLLFQAWYRYGQAEDWERARYALQTVLIVEPGNQQARSLLERLGSPSSP